MEKTESSGGGLSRRTFLEGNWCGCWGLGACGSCRHDHDAGMACACAGKRRGRGAHRVHLPSRPLPRALLFEVHCAGRALVRVIEPNDIWDDKHFRAVCPKGLSEIQHVYSQDRVQTPLRRVGERGAGEFVPITWDEALDELAGKIHEMLGRVWQRVRSVRRQRRGPEHIRSSARRAPSAPRARGSAASMRAFSAAWIRCTEAWAQEPRRATGAMRKRCS